MQQPTLDDLDRHYPLIIVGGGISGAGVLHAATAVGLKALLVEQGDFASGTSSGSSKLVHGGLRYLAQGQWRLTWESVRERQHLLGQRPGLVERQPFLMPIYQGMSPSQRTMRLGLMAYDLMAGRFASRSLSARQALELQPQIRREGLLGAVSYEDARTDDARLVFRLIAEACEQGACALHYTRALSLQKQGGRVRGVELEDAEGHTRAIEASVVVDATGTWAGLLGGDGAPQLRPLRGSHLLFPEASLPLKHAVSWLHPSDKRPIFAYPWEGVSLVGTTDLDHDGDLTAPLASVDEVRYLMEGLNHQFPDSGLDIRQAISQYAGVRPVVASGADDPSAESRESAMWEAPGLIGITGGKLTTFRVTALQVLQAAARQSVGSLSGAKIRKISKNGSPSAKGDRMSARYGDAFKQWLADQPDDRTQPIASSSYCLAELAWAAQHECIRHLDDLLLRRTRLGLVAPNGGIDLLPDLESACRGALGWNTERWQSEVDRYAALWTARHAPPTSL